MNTSEWFRHVPTTGRGEATLTLNLRHRAPYRVPSWLYGKFCEHLGANIYHGMEAQILFNPTFARWRFSAGDRHPDGGVQEESRREVIQQRIEGRARRLGWPDPEPIQDAYFDGGSYGWYRLGDRAEVRLSPDVGPHGHRAQRVEILRARPGDPRGIAQWIYLPLHRTRGYQYRLVARSIEPTALVLSILPAEGNRSAVQRSIALGPDWQTVTGELTIPGDWDPDTLYTFTLTCDRPAHLVLDRALLYPDDHRNGADPDVIRLLRESRLPLLRWPGGNFASGYHWRDGVGPIDARPTLPNPAWEGVEFNLFGTDEFIAFCREVGCEPLICVNAGDGTPEEAAAWVEYCNGGPETPMGRLRAEHGHPEPYNVKLWEIGNEIYGRWQVSWTTPEGYVDRYRHFQEAMRRVDPSIQLLACGYGNDPDSPWNQRLIEELGSELRCITDHILTGGRVDAHTDPIELTHAFLGYATELESRYRELRERMREAGISDPRLAITELQLFAHFHGDVDPNGRLSPSTMPTQDSISEALYHATIVHTCIRLGEFVEMLTHSATVNHGGGLRKQRERVYPNPVHYSHALGMALAGGTPIGIQLACETFSTRHTFGHIPPLRDVPVLDAMAVADPEGALQVMLVHRGADIGPLELSIRIEGGSAGKVAEVVTLAGETWHDRNTLEQPDKIVPRRSRAETEDGKGLRLTLPPFSLTRLTFPDISWG